MVLGVLELGVGTSAAVEVGVTEALVEAGVAEMLEVGTWGMTGTEVPVLLALVSSTGG